MAHKAKRQKQKERIHQHIKKTNTILIAIVAAVAVVALFLLYSSVNRDVAGQAYSGAFDCETVYKQCMDMAQRMDTLRQQWLEKWGSGYDKGGCGNYIAMYEQHCDVQKASCESNFKYAQEQAASQQQYGQGAPTQPPQPAYNQPTAPSYPSTQQPSYPPAQSTG